jgi:hypothetical protein
MEMAAANEPNVKVIKRLTVKEAVIERNSKLNAAVTEWREKGDELYQAIQASQKAGEKLKTMLGPLLTKKGLIREEDDWRVKKDGEGIVAEIIERKTAGRRSRIDTDDVDF